MEAVKMVIYFSGTGNSRYAAEIIAKETGDDCVSLNKRMKEGDLSPLSSTKPFVLVAPVYAGRIPKIVEKHLEKTQFIGNNKIYFIFTCADTPWITYKYIEKEFLPRKALESMGWNSVIMPQGWIAGSKIASKEENNKILDEAEPRIHSIATVIAKGNKLPEEKQGKSWMSTIANPMMYSMMVKDKKFYVADACIGCGTCAERCPENNITIENGKPVWHGNCTHCCACIAGCPKQAIEYGKSTIGQVRYYNTREA